MKINFAAVTDDDSLADAMKAARTLDKKKMLMRYKRLKAECMAKDPGFTQKVLRNYFTLIRKVGSVYKRGGKLIATWQQRFVVVSNAGLVYFKVDEMRKEEDLEPQNFKPLNDFAITEVDEKSAGRAFAFKIVFCEGSIIQKDLLLAAQNDADRREWIDAFRQHQIDTIAARSKFLEKKLEKVGVMVPRATVLIQKQVTAKEDAQFSHLLNNSTIGRRGADNSFSSKSPKSTKNSEGRERSFK